LSPIFIEQPLERSHPNFSGIGYRAPLLSGESGTKQTIAVMRKLVDQAVGDQSFVRFAKDVVRGVLPYNDIGEASAVYEWVKQNIRYTKDPVTKETLYPPSELLKIRAGDCDDIVMLMGAMMIALGYPARLVTIAANAGDPNEFSHVYLEAEVPPGSAQWVAMDAARSGAQFGVEPPVYYRKRAWSLIDNSYQDLAGCGCGCGSRVSRPTKFSGLAGVATISGLGYDGLGQDGFDWGALLQTSIQETPALIAAAGGQPVRVQTPGSVVATGPYSSFATPATPGYGLPTAGYGSTVSVGTSGSWLPWLIGGAFLVLLIGRK
jgi:Transglutaminase-like superfamily